MKEVLCIIEADFLGVRREFEVKAESHEQAIGEFKKLPLLEALKNVTMADIVDSYDAKTTEIDLSDMTFKFPEDEDTNKVTDKDIEELLEFLAEELSDSPTKYSQEDVCVGDFAKIHVNGVHGIEPHLYVTRVGVNSFDCKGDYGRYTDIPYADIIDLKTEDDIFEVAGRQ